MKKILATAVLICSASVTANAASIPPEPARVQLLTDNPAPVKGDQLVFSEKGGCLLYGVVDAAMLAVINRRVCPGTSTDVTMVVPLNRAPSFTEALNNDVALAWLTGSTRNYYMFPVEAADPAIPNQVP